VRWLKRYESARLHATSVLIFRLIARTQYGSLFRATDLTPSLCYECVLAVIPEIFTAQSNKIPKDTEKYTFGNFA